TRGRAAPSGALAPLRVVRPLRVLVAGRPALLGRLVRRAACVGRAAGPARGARDTLLVAVLLGALAAHGVLLARRAGRWGPDTRPGGAPIPPGRRPRRPAPGEGQIRPHIRAVLGHGWNPREAMARE